jgi:hypothetical protein
MHAVDEKGQLPGMPASILEIRDRVITYASIKITATLVIRLLHT